MTFLHLTVALRAVLIGLAVINAVVAAKRRVHPFIGFQRKIIKALFARDLPEAQPRQGDARLVERLAAVRVIVPQAAAQLAVVPAVVGIVQQPDGALDEPPVARDAVEAAEQHRVPRAVVVGGMEGCDARLLQLVGLEHVAEIIGLCDHILPVALLARQDPEVINVKEHLGRLPDLPALVEQIFGVALKDRTEFSRHIVALPEVGDQVVHGQCRELQMVVRRVGGKRFQELFRLCLGQGYCHWFVLLCRLPTAAAQAQREQHAGSQEQCDRSFHSCTSVIPPSM